MFVLQVRQMLVAPLQVLQLSVQAWHKLFTPAYPSGQLELQVVLNRNVPLVQERQSAAEVHFRQGETQAVH